MKSPLTMLPGLERPSQTMPFDQFGRYHMMREAIDACRVKLGAERLKILDVGGYYLNPEGQHTLPIMPFFPEDDVLVLDVEDCVLPGYIRGDGTRLDFADASFDFVVTADTLEHIPRPDRAAFWHELLRVARHGVILLAPFASPQVDAAETILFEFIKSYLHSEHAMLREHLIYGLPRLDEWLPFLAEAKVTARSYPTGYLNAWLGMMMIKHLLMKISPGPAAQYQVDTYYNQVFFPTERRNPAYRHMIVAEKTAGLVDAVDAVIAPTLMPDYEDSVDWGQALLPTMLTVVQHQLGTIAQTQTDFAAHYNELMRHYTFQVGQHQEQVGQHQEQVAHYQQHISMLDRVIADQQMLLNRNTALEQAITDQQAAQRQRTAQAEGAIGDLTARANWLDQQNQVLRAQLEAIQQGRVMKLLSLVSGRK